MKLHWHPHYWILQVSVPPNLWSRGEDRLYSGNHFWTIWWREEVELNIRCSWVPECQYGHVRDCLWYVLWHDGWISITHFVICNLCFTYRNDWQVLVIRLQWHHCDLDHNYLAIMHCERLLCKEPLHLIISCMCFLVARLWWHTRAWYKFRDDNWTCVTSKSIIKIGMPTYLFRTRSMFWPHFFAYWPILSILALRTWRAENLDQSVVGAWKTWSGVAD